MSRVSVFIDIDFERLKKQKQFLIEQKCEKSQGLLNLIDAIQDHVVATGQLKESEVFVTEETKSAYEYHTLERKSDKVVAYGWRRYPVSSVLAGQPMKCFLDSYELEDIGKAKADYPDAEWSSPWTEPQVSLNHLSDEPDC